MRTALAGVVLVLMVGCGGRPTSSPGAERTFKADPARSEHTVAWMKGELALLDADPNLHLARQRLGEAPEVPFIREYCRALFGVDEVKAATIDRAADRVGIEHGLPAEKVEQMPLWEFATKLQKMARKTR